MRLFIACLAALALLASPAMACPPVDDGGGSFSFGGGYGAEACAAPMVAGNFGGGYGGGVMVAAPSYSASFAAPSYHVQTFAAPRVYAAPVVQQRVVAAPVYGYGGGGGFAVGRRFRGGFGGGAYGTAVVAAPVRVRAFAAPVYGGAAVVAAPVVAVPVRAPGPIRGAVHGFFGGLRNRLNGF